jgi:hypothetical protein
MEARLVANGVELWVGKRRQHLGCEKSLCRQPAWSSHLKILSILSNRLSSSFTLRTDISKPQLLGIKHGAQAGETALVPISPF